MPSSFFQALYLYFAVKLNAPGVSRLPERRGGLGGLGVLGVWNSFLQGEIGFFRAQDRYRRKQRLTRCGTSAVTLGSLLVVAVELKSALPTPLRL